MRTLIFAAALVLGNVVQAAIPQSGLVACYPFDGNPDDIEGGHDAALYGGVYLTSNRHGSGSSAYSFNGETAYMEIDDHDVFSLSNTGELTISAWMRPGTLNFPNNVDNRYVYWMGKGYYQQHEWAFRMYTLNNPVGRKNRTSVYLFNLSGGLGAGSYIQEPVAKGVWIHYVATFSINDDIIKWYKNGVLKDSDPFIDSPYEIKPGNGIAPVRLGTRDFHSFFKGALDDICIYNRVLSASEIAQLYQDDTL